MTARRSASGDSREARKEQTHARIVTTASRAVRRSGCAGVGVAEVMGEAGLTHGGFYAHFDSREAMLAEAVAHAAQDSRDRLDAHVASRVAGGTSPLRALVEAYLSDAHRTAVEGGCVVAALASELPRQPAPVRAVAAERVRRLVERVRHALPPDSAAGAAEAIASAMVGALLLARTVDDDAEAATLLRRARRSLLARYDH